MLQLRSHPEAEHVSDVTRIATHFNAGQWYMNDKKNTALGKYDTAIGRKGASQDRALQW